MNRKGFTLIELLIVIAILGILGAILFVTIGGNPQRDARDSRRLTDINQLQLALELYYNDNAAYPASLSDLATGGYIGGVPADPSTGDPYTYATVGDSYVLRAQLENCANKALATDVDGTVGTTDCSDNDGTCPDTSMYYCVNP